MNKPLSTNLPIALHTYSESVQKVKDDKIFSAGNYGGISVQIYKFFHILNLEVATNVRLSLNHCNEESGVTVAGQYGLVVRFYKFQ